MQRAIKYTYTAVICLILAAIFFSFPIKGVGARIARADVPDVVYSDVMDDLQKAENFNAEDYPSYIGGACVQVIQIAESEHNELFIYVHSPTYYSFKATSINISTTIRDSLKYDNYKLTRLSSSGAFTKYLVEGLEVRKDPLRYYDISSIYRAWDSELDDDPDNNNTVSEVAFPVGQLWTACTVGGEVSYSMDVIEVLNVTQQFVHFIRYGEGFQWGGIKSCDAHYFAFNCNHDIDKLISADLLFYTQDYKRMEGQTYKFLEERTKHFVTVDSTMQGASNKNTWQRMSSTAEFLSDNKDSVPSDEAAKIKNYDWIINFYETEYERDFGGKDILISLLVPGGFIWGIVDACTTYGTMVTDVTLMRLEFEYEGEIYNLGVVSDKQSGSPEPPLPDDKGANIFDKINGFFDFFVKLWNTVKDFSWWHWLLIVVGAVVAIALVVMIIKWGIAAVFKFIFWLIAKLLQGLWWLVTLPFRLIAKAVRNRMN